MAIPILLTALPVVASRLDFVVRPQEATLAKNTGRGSRTGAVTGRSQTKTAAGVWMKRNTSTGTFVQAKKTGGAFKGVRKET